MPPKKLLPAAAEAKTKNAKKWSGKWFILLAFLVAWIASTWVVSFLALKHDNSSVSRRHAKDISSYFGTTSRKIKKQSQAFVQKEVHLRVASPQNQQQENANTLPLTAYLEPPLPPYDPNQTPRLPSRTPGPLNSIVYNSVHSCADLPNGFPIRVPRDDSDCPVMQDPFLPWIHDVFLDHTHQTVEFVAHNQRRCNTQPAKFYDRLAHLEPQAVLQQSVPLKKLGNGQYQLTSLERADFKETRFLCRFKDHQNQPIAVVPSRFPYNYEHANYQKKNSSPLLTRPKDQQDTKNSLHNEQVWNSLLRFQCSVPKELRLALSHSHLHDRQFYVDVVPVRTHPRLDRAGYFDRKGRNMTNDDVTFDPTVEWGDHHVLPPLEASGRWENIPLCPHDQHVAKEGKDKQVAVATPTTKDPPKHFLTACVWASASFSTRGSPDIDTSTSERLLEWLAYQLYVAKLDHVYVYDNSQAHGTTLTLEPVLGLFPTSRVTRIPWKAPVCNNNKPGAANPGERSSQYAAETSCRVRFGHDTTWMTVLDADEYLVPQAPFGSIREWLQQSHGETKIWSFFQTRAVPHRDYLDPIANVINDVQEPLYQWKKKPRATYLETYNCDRHPFPKPGWAWRAKKQIFRPSYVLLHFVHYSLVTTRLLEHPSESSGLYNDRPPFEKRVDERREGFLLHAKTTSPAATQYWRKQCRTTKDNNCPIGLAFPPGVQEGAVHEELGMPYNCYSHERITEDIAPRLRELLEPLRVKYQQLQAKAN